VTGLGVLLGGAPDAQDIQKAAGQAAERAEGVVGKFLALFDHIWHELESGDVMTWVAFVAAFVFVFAGFGLLVGLWRGSITFKLGGK